MRKTAQKIKEAFDAGRERTVRNTRTDGERVFLHGNQIIKRVNGEVFFTLAGWNTVTTRSRIKEITGAGVGQRNFEPVYHGRVINSNKWYLVTESRTQSINIDL
jgi:hypothetical protein